MLSRAGTLSIVLCFALMFVLSTMLVDKNGGNALLLRGSDVENFTDSVENTPSASSTGGSFLRGSNEAETETDDDEVKVTSVMSQIVGSECQVISSVAYSMVFASECREAEKCLVEVATMKESKKNTDEIVRRINESTFPGLPKIIQNRQVDEDYNFIALMTLPEGVELASVGSLVVPESFVEAQISNIINHLNRQGIWTHLHGADKKSSTEHAFGIDKKTEKVYLISLATLTLMED